MLFTFAGIYANNLKYIIILVFVAMKQIYIVSTSIFSIVNNIFLLLLLMIIIIIEASRGAGAESVTVKSTGCGFEPQSRKWNIYLPEISGIRTESKRTKCLDTRYLLSAYCTIGQNGFFSFGFILIMMIYCYLWLSMFCYIMLLEGARDFARLLGVNSKKTTKHVFNKIFLTVWI